MSNKEVSRSYSGPTDKPKVLPRWAFPNFTDEEYQEEIVEEKYFKIWMELFKTKVEKLPENYKSFFDLRETNWNCWREMYQQDYTPEGAVEECVEDLLRMQ